MKIERQYRNSVYKYDRFAWKIMYCPPPTLKYHIFDWCTTQFGVFETWSYTPQTQAQAFDDRWIYWFTTVEQVVLFKLRWALTEK